MMPCTTAEHQLPLRTSLTAWILNVDLKQEAKQQITQANLFLDGPHPNRREPVRALPAPLGAEAAQHTGAEELPQVQKPLLEQTAYDTGPRQPCLAQGQISASGNLSTPLSTWSTWRRRWSTCTLTTMPRCGT